MASWLEIFLKKGARGARLKSSRLLGVFTAGIIFLSAGLLQAQLIDVDFNSTIGTINHLPAYSPTMSGAAVLGAAGDQWNGIDATSGTGISLINADGSASAVTMTFTSAGSSDVTTPFASTPYNNLMQDYIYTTNTFGTVGAQTITLSGLANNRIYNLVLYSAANAGPVLNADFDTEFTVNGNTKVTDWGTYNGTNSTFVAGVDYVQFTSATPDGSGNLVITYKPDPAIYSGNVGVVNGFQIQVQPPVVTITSPANGAVFTAPANVTIAASATYGGGTASSVQFFANGVSLGTVLSSPFSFTASNLTYGAYALTAVATAAGISVTSSVVNMTVTGQPAAQPYTWTTLAGYPGYGSADGMGNNAFFHNPSGVTVDSAGNVYVTDTANNTIREISFSGSVATVSTIAGSVGISGTNDGVGGAALFNAPFGIAVDRATNIYVADTGNSTIRKLTPSGTNWMVSTIAGLAGSPGSADGTNSSARFNFSKGGMFYYAGNLYLSDDGNNSGNNKIRKLTPSGTNWVVTTIVAGLAGAGSITADGAGNLYVADQIDETVRKITPVGTNWMVTTIATMQEYPSGIAIDTSGNLYVAINGQNVVYKLTPSGGTLWNVTFWAGQTNSGGSADGSGTNAQFNEPQEIAIGSQNFIYVADTGNNEIRRITTGGTVGNVTTLAGEPYSVGSANGTGSAGRFISPFGIAVDNANNVYVADTYNDTIREISSGYVSTFAGTSGSKGYANGPGGLFNMPYGVVVNTNGNLYIADSGNLVIRQITPSLQVSTIAGLNNTANTNDGVGSAARFENPTGIAKDGAGNLYVADGSSVIRKITPAGVVSTIAGMPFQYGSADGTNSTARFNFPGNSYYGAGTGIGIGGVAADSTGNVYVADSGNLTIRKITPVGNNWVVSTIAGLAGTPGTNDGVGNTARFGQSYYGGGPSGITVDSAGNLYVTDSYNLTIRKITPVGSNWVVSTIGGLPVTPGNVDGTGSAARFGSIYSFVEGGPTGVAVDSAGNLYVADYSNKTIRKGSFTAYLTANPVPYANLLINAQLTVTLIPANANGQWRFPWEIGWRDSGTTASNLVAGNYPVQFKSVPGWLAVPSSLTVPVPNGTATFVTNQYYPTISSVSANSGGTLTVSFVSGNPTNAGWRFLRGLGDTTPYYPAGSTNLVAGTYLIQFAPIAGRITPPNLSIQVLAGQTTFLTENYLIAPTNSNGIALPYPVPTTPINEISDLTDYPFGFNGQLQSDVGYGSGVAVQTNVVLTAAHLVFSDETLSYVSQAYWFFQQETGVFAPIPQAARGWYILSDYAAQRISDLTNGYAPDISSAQSQNFDVATLYFLSPVANGGYGGYLPSDALPNPWLTGTSLKMLVGYPVDGSEFGNASVTTNAGTMYQTQPQQYPLSLSTGSVTNQQEVYTDPYFLGYPGNSGGPVYVQFNGYYYPAGVYLGTAYNNDGSPKYSLVRAIDSAVVNLITNAAAMGDMGTNINNSGGGVITIIPSQAVSASTPGYLEFQLGPPAAVAAGAGWELSGDSAFSSATNYIRQVLTTNAFTVVFNQIPGWNVPVISPFSVLPGVVTIITNALYTVATPLQIISPQVSGGAFQLSFQSVSGQSYTLYYNTNLTTSNWLPYTNVTGNGGTMQFNVPINNSAQSFFRIGAQ